MWRRTLIETYETQYPRGRAARFERLQTSLQRASERGTQRFRSVIVPGKGHSTLTFDYQTALDRGVDTRERVLRHLRTQLLDSNEPAS